ncbi:MAG: 50S ribosomal protein L28 [Deltaproteobacteria bacterium]|nr:50S ribosomal protein L28 [Deltaproteobacteria bacterium]
MARTCAFTGKRPNSANKVSHSNHKTKRRQLPNLQTRRIWWAEGDTFIKVKLSTRALRTIDKKGLEVFASEVGLKLADYVVA